MESDSFLANTLFDTLFMKTFSRLNLVQAGDRSSYVCGNQV